MFNIMAVISFLVLLLTSSILSIVSFIRGEIILGFVLLGASVSLTLWFRDDNLY